MIPDKDVMCHRTGFLKTCRECVVEHKCRLWKRVTLEHHPETGAAGVDHYDCLDSLNDLYAKDMLRRQVQTTASVNHLTNEVHAANSTGMADAMMGINRMIRGHGADHAARIATSADPQPKLLEG